MTHLRTAWHPVFVLLLEQLLPTDVWRVVAEYVLTREPRRIDAVIIRRVGVRSDWHADYLRSVLDNLRDHNVVHFKGATDELEAADALRVVETAVVWPQAHEHLLYAVSPACLDDRQPRARGFDDRERELFYHLAQVIARLASDPKWKAIMKDAALVEASAEATIKDLIAKLPAAWRLAGLKPDEVLAHFEPETVLAHFEPETVLAHFEPEERLAGLDPAHAVLALPVEVLRGLSPEYIATLPDDVRATVRARLAR